MEREKMPIIFHNNWRIRSVKIFDRYGWVAQKVGAPEITRTSEDTYNDPETALNYSKTELIYHNK